MMLLKSRDDSLEILIGIAKCNKYGTRGRGDGVEVAERPTGGISVILADGYGGARSVNGIGSRAALKAAQLVADGVHDGSIARSIFDYFNTAQDGNFSITMTMIGADLESGNLLICRNTNCPSLIRHEFGIDPYNEPVQPIGVHKNVKTVTVQRPLEEGIIVVTFSDGVLNAGRKRGRELDMKSIVRLLEESEPKDVQYLAETILEQAMALDSYQAMDHMSVAVLGVDGKTMENRVEYRNVRYPA